MINCLSYALRFWHKNKEYNIYYNSDHCINIPSYVINPFPNKEFLPIEEFGYDYFSKWYDQELITIKDLGLLNLYFIKKVKKLGNVQ